MAKQPRVVSEMRHAAPSDITRSGDHAEYEGSVLQRRRAAVHHPIQGQEEAMVRHFPIIATTGDSLEGGEVRSRYGQAPYLHRSPLLPSPPPSPPPAPNPPTIPPTPPARTRPPTGGVASARSRKTRAAALPRLSTAPLTPETLRPLLDSFDRALSHTHYAVCGHAALVAWGYRPDPASLSARMPPQQAILAWARAVGWAVYAPDGPASCPSPRGVAAAGGGGGGGGGEVIGVPVPGSSPAVVVGFRLRTVDDAAWSRLGRVRPRDAGLPAQVLAVPTLLDEMARAWYACAVRRGELGSARERYVAGLVFWFLRRLAEDAQRGRRAPLTPRDLPVLTCRRVWSAFVGRYHGARALLASCGLYPAADAAEDADEGGSPKPSPPTSLVQLLRRLDSSRPSRRVRRAVCCDVQ
ncbi:hypothetical protein VTH06DRAFT_8301 [Thermothelomyces fergusii]